MFVLATGFWKPRNFKKFLVKVRFIMVVFIQPIYYDLNDTQGQFIKLITACLNSKISFSILVALPRLNNLGCPEMYSAYYDMNVI